AATPTLSETHYTQAYADLTLALKDPAGATVATVRTATGTATLPDTQLSAAGNYTAVITNNSTDVNVPSYTLTLTVPRRRPGSINLQLKNGSGTVVATAPAAKPAVLTATVVPGSYSIVATPTSGSGTATLDATYPSNGQPVTISYDANDHATVIDDGATRTEETLSPSGRVLRRVVKALPAGTVTQDVLYGYDGPGDSPAYERANTAPPAVHHTDDWTGVDSGGWNAVKWVTTTNDGAKTADIQTNQGRLQVTTAAARATAQMAAVADSEVNFSYEFSDRNAGSALRITLRGSPAAGADELPSGYRLEIASDSTTVKLQRVVAGAATLIGSFAYSVSTNPQNVRFRVQGSSIQAKIWPAGTPEPTDWFVSATDATITGGGVAQIAHNYTSGAARSVKLDNLNVLATTPVQATTTNVAGPEGLLLIDNDGTPTYPLANGHGDIIGTTNAAGAFTATPVTDEFGQGQAPANRLGWLGTQQRYTTHPGTGIIRMGVRLYDPSLGRFHQADPIEGGSANDYEYVLGDCVNNVDLDGTRADRISTPTPFMADFPAGPCDNKMRPLKSRYKFKKPVLVKRTYEYDFDLSSGEEVNVKTRYRDLGYAGAYTITTCERGGLMRRHYYDRPVHRYYDVYSAFFQTVVWAVPGKWRSGH
ncbi:MAG: RHS repeat-associated core domain-containing protein, partial [Gaiellales bacterium]